MEQIKNKDTKLKVLWFYQIAGGVAGLAMTIYLIAQTATITGLILLLYLIATAASSKPFSVVTSFKKLMIHFKHSVYLLLLCF